MLRNPLVKIIRSISRVFFWIAGLIVLVTMLLTVSDIFSRFVLNKPFAFTFELTELMMIIVTFLGLGYITAINRQIDVDILVPRLPLRVQGAIGAFNALLGIGLFSLIAWQTAIRALQVWQENLCTEILKLTMTPVIFIVSLGSLLLCLELVIVLIGSLGEAVKGRQGHFYLE